MPHLYDDEDCAADLAVIGLGPGGLVAALSAADEGKKVVAFTDRESYIRGQRLLINEITRDILFKYRDESDVDDVEFWRRLDSEGTVQTKDIERYLYRKLAKHPNVCIVKIDKQRNDIKSLGNVSEKSHAPYIGLRDGTEYYCKNIVAADGARHNFATIVSRDLSQEITYVRSPYQDRSKYHASVLLHLKKGEEIPASSSLATGCDESRSALCRLGWDKDYEPNYYVCVNQDKTKFNFTGAIPACIFETPYDERRELLKQWASQVIYQKFGVEPQQLEYRCSAKNPAKDRLQATVFELEVIICKNPTLKLPGGGVFTQIGDARRTPYYRIGHGVNDAIRGGALFASALEGIPKGIMMEDYERMACNMDKYVDDKMMVMQSTQAKESPTAESKPAP